MRVQCEERRARWDKVLHYHNMRMFCMKITVITLDYPNKLSDNPKQILRQGRGVGVAGLLFSFIHLDPGRLRCEVWSP